MASDDLNQTTYEQATRCPRCDKPGEVVSRVPAQLGTAKPGTKVHTVMCRNEECRWHNTGWVVQVNPDGSIPTPITDRPKDLRDKQYPARYLRDEERRLIESVERQVRQETQPGGGEVGRR